jgi:hypothetical protein
MNSGIFFLDRNKGRSDALDRIFDALANLPREQLFIVSVEEWHPRLADNLRARIKIVVRQLAAFCGLTYESMNKIVHDKFYPVVDMKVAGVEYHTTKETNALLPEEARDIEAELHTFAAEMGCPLTDPRDRYNQYE